MSFFERYSQLDWQEKRTLKKGGCMIIVLFLVLVGCMRQAIDATFAPDPTETASETPYLPPLPPDAELPAVTASPSPVAPKATKKPPKASLPQVVFDVVATTSCPVVGCLTVAVHANVACKSVTVSADVYDENDEWIDSIEQSFRGLAKGSTRRFTLTDSEYEDWQLELSDVLCG